MTNEPECKIDEYGNKAWFLSNKRHREERSSH
jgi:hypothetical protein